MALGMRDTVDGLFNLDDYGEYDSSSPVMARRSSKRRRKRNKLFKKSTRHTRRYARKKHRSGRGKIKHTSKGQPYIILPNGRAKFIKKRGHR